QWNQPIIENSNGYFRNEGQKDKAETPRKRIEHVAIVEIPKSDPGTRSWKGIIMSLCFVDVLWAKNTYVTNKYSFWFLVF
ncbi:MAG: hypothetical protein ACO2ZP_03350, partial [Bacteriovoracaceae bacterium]